MSAFQLLTQQAIGMSGDRIPLSVLNQARLCILDTLGCILAGTKTEECRLILACEPEQPSGAIKVFGTTHSRGLREAIRINAYLGDVLELNDLIGGHASIGTVTAAMGLAEAVSASGLQLLEAVVRGIEVTSRVYEAIYPSLRRYTEMGLVPVGIPSTIGAAAAAAHLLRLNDQQTLDALAIAGSLAGWCPAEVIFGQGGTVKPMLFGAQPADTGVTAAYYALAGMTGPLDLLDSKIGYFSTTSVSGNFDEDAWKDKWALGKPRRKLHACCGYLHSPVDALGMLREKLPAGALQDGQISVRVSPYVADVVSKERMPNSPNDARFHLQYCLALVACGSDVILPEHSIELDQQMLRSNVIDAMKRISVIQDTALNHYHHCSVQVLDTNGNAHVQNLSAPRGSPQEPMTDAQVINKFRMLAEPVIGTERTEKVIIDVLTIEKMINVSALATSLSNKEKKGKV
ncbi:MAG: MmgE/PrpD family protein [Betaproteobacteria bacterium]